MTTTTQAAVVPTTRMQTEVAAGVTTIVQDDTQLPAVVKTQGDSGDDHDDDNA